MQKNGMSGTEINPGQGLESKTQNHGGIIANKYMAAMAKAEELLYGSDIHTTIYDNLNCGKLSHFIRYIRRGSTCLLLYYSYVEYVIN